MAAHPVTRKLSPGESNWRHPQTHKTCEQCGLTKPVSDFARVPTADVLYARKCRACDYPAALKRAHGYYKPRVP